MTKTYTATDLAFYDFGGTTELNAANKAAEMASHLIAQFSGMELPEAAAQIALATSLAYPLVGANDTASREAILTALEAARASGPETTTWQEDCQRADDEAAARSILGDDLYEAVQRYEAAEPEPLLERVKATRDRLRSKRADGSP